MSIGLLPRYLGRKLKPDFSTEEPAYSNAQVPCITFLERFVFAAYMVRDGLRSRSDTSDRS